MRLDYTVVWEEDFDFKIPLLNHICWFGKKRNDTAHLKPEVNNTFMSD